MELNDDIALPDADEIERNTVSLFPAIAFTTAAIMHGPSPEELVNGGVAGCMLISDPNLISILGCMMSKEMIDHLIAGLTELRDSGEVTWESSVGCEYIEGPNVH